MSSVRVLSRISWGRTVCPRRFLSSKSESNKSSILSNKLNPSEKKSGSKKQQHQLSWFLCPHCTTFRDPCKTTLKSHISKVHGLDPFLCPGCQNQFKNFRLFQKHIRETHPGIPVPKEPYETTTLCDGHEGLKQPEVPLPLSLYTLGEPLQYLGRNQVFLAQFYPLKMRPKFVRLPSQAATQMSAIEAVNSTIKDSSTPDSVVPRGVWYAPGPPLDYVGRNASFLTSLYPMKDFPPFPMEYQVTSPESKDVEIPLEVVIEPAERGSILTASPWQILTALADVLKVQVPPLALSFKTRLQKAIQNL